MEHDDAQQILDELAGRMTSTHVRDPVRYCARLVERFKRGEFHLELGRAVALQRQEVLKRQAASTIASDANEESVFEIGGLPVRIRNALERIRRAANCNHKEDGDGQQTQFSGSSS
jgi:hypothetical protein